MRARAVLDPGGLFRYIPLRPHQFTEAVTPTRDLFVLAHLGVARVDPVAWSLDIDGLVRCPQRLTLADLQRFPKREVLSFHECAGNPLTPEVPERRVANVVWGGVTLETLLDKVGVEPTASYIWSYGLDHGPFAGTQNDSYLKDLPLRRVKAGDVLVAYELNGEPLSAEHGFPARLLVPGWYGTNSVKWLYRMVLADRRADGPFTTVFYNEVIPSSPGASTVRTRPVWEVAPESVIVAPAPDERLQVGTPAEIWGWAWSAKGIRTVEVSVDGGETWHAAAVNVREQWSWQRFHVAWRPSEPGGVTLLCRASDLAGATQPPRGARNAIHAVPVTVVT